MTLPTLEELAVWVASPHHYAGLPHGAAADGALDREDAPEIETVAIAASDALKDHLTHHPLSSELTERVEKISEDAFCGAFEATRSHHDFSAQVSDEIWMIARASASGYTSPFLEALWRDYAAGRRIIGEPLRIDNERV